MFKIEKGVPLPVCTGKYRGTTATIRALEIGDSFVFAGEGKNIRQTAKNVGVKISQRRQPDGTFRVWRIA